MHDLLKLDVEGHEYGVLAGARRVIAESPGLEVVMEFDRHACRHDVIEAAQRDADEFVRVIGRACE